MPTYELTLIMKKMSRPLLVDALKRTGGYIYQNDGYIRKIESYGERRLPNIKKKDGLTHTEGNYVMMEVDLKVNSIPTLRDEMKRDEEILQRFLTVVKHEENVCPLDYDNELLPVSERPSIQELIKEGRRLPRFRKIYSNNTGLDYYPFKR